MSHGAARRQLASLRISEELVNDIQLAIVELTTNAVIHASPAPSTITLKIDLLGAQLRIEITDDGAPFIGFEEAWAAAAKRDVAASHSSGLGLALACNLLHTVTYHPGPPNRLTGMSPLAYRRPAIMLVEDDHTLRRMYSLMLRSSYRIYPAESVDVALGIISVRKIDLIVSDFHIGDEPATKLLTEIERDPKRLPIPAIILSGDPAHATRARAEGFGIEQFLTKPVAANDLRKGVERGLAASHRRLTGMLRHFGASVDELLAAPSPAALRVIGMGSCGASAEIGNGDFVLLLGGTTRQRIILADVMGHGLQAAAGAIAFAATLRSVHAVQRMAAPARPGDFLSTVSTVMTTDESLASMIVTLLVIDRLDDGTLEFASAGHPAPVVVGPDATQQLDIAGPLLGLCRADGYQTLSVQLDASQRILVFTDGVEPVLSAAGGALPEALVAAVRQTLDQPPDSALAGINAWATATLGPNPRDDWTIMLLDGST